MKISETSPVRFAVSQEPVRKHQLSSPMPLAAVQPAPVRPLAAPASSPVVQTQPATEPVTYSVHNRRAASAANDNPPPPRAGPLQINARSAYEMVAGFDPSS